MRLSEAARGALESGAYRRESAERVEETLLRMGVPMQGDFAEFYRQYAGPFASRRTGFELLELCADGENSIESMTRICRERFGLPSRYFVLTELLGGGVLMFDSSSGGVYSVDFEGGLERLVAGELPMQWEGFQQFLNFYFG